LPNRNRVQGAEPSLLPDKLPEAFESSADLIGTRVRTAPAFLQPRDGQSDKAADVSEEDADKLAEEGAAGGGPLGPGLSPEEWFDGVVIGYLSHAWEQHAAAVDQGAAGVAAVRHDLIRQRGLRAAPGMCWILRA
jgi:hypothetical protein